MSKGIEPYLRGCRSESDDTADRAAEFKGGLGIHEDVDTSTLRFHELGERLEGIPR